MGSSISFLVSSKYHGVSNEEVIQNSKSDVTLCFRTASKDAYTI
jgi:hypothetical protein